MKICQSCGMPLEDTENYGTNEDGTKNKDYCTYCYDEGAFTQNMDMEDMIEFCIPFMTEDGTMTEDEAREMLEKTLPTLKRWA